MQRRPGLLVCLAAFLLYHATLAPTFLWSDSAKLALYVHDRVFWGTALGLHPLHGILGCLFSLLPFSLAWTQNLMSAVFAAAGVYLLFRLVRDDTGDACAALLASASLAVSHVFWLYAVINETYSLLVCTMLGSLLLASRWRQTPGNGLLCLQALLLGAAIANHGMILLVVPSLTILYWKNEFRAFLHSPLWIALAVCLFLLGLAPVLLIPIAQLGLSAFATEMLRTGSEHSSSYLIGIGKLLRELPRVPLYLAYQFPSPALLAGIYAFVRGLTSRSRLFVSMLVMAVLVSGFASQYFAQRQFAMLSPAFAAFAFFAGTGFSEFRKRHPERATRNQALAAALLICALPPAVYFTAYRAFDSSASLSRSIRPLPYRDTARYFLFPPKCMERGAEKYAADSFRQAERDAIIVADFNPGMALVYAQQVLGQRKDLRIEIVVDEWVHHSPDPGREMLQYLKENAPHRTIYLADHYEPYYHVSAIRAEFDVLQTGGPLWQVIPRGER